MQPGPSTVSASSEHASLKVERWKCVCNTCSLRRRQGAVCNKACTRGKDEKVFSYYNFVASHCDEQELSVEMQKGTVNKLRDLYKDHGMEKLKDTQEMNDNAIMARNFSGTIPKCWEDTNGCVDFSFKEKEGTD